MSTLNNSMNLRNVADAYFNIEIKQTDERRQSLRTIADVYLNAERQESLQHVAVVYFSVDMNS